MASLAIALYEQAADLAPEEVTPLLGLANVFERQGDYERALPHLERALRVAPGHREALLRRGILLRRLGRVAEAESLLRRLVRQQRADWILSLAYQELARSRAWEGDRVRARELLLEARRRLPEDPSLPVQIAYLNDRTDSSEPIESFGETLRASAASPHPSPRSLYARIPTQPLETLRRNLDERSRPYLLYLDERLDRLVGPSDER